METEVHPTAIIESGAQLGNNVTVGPYAYIGANVKIGDGCVIQHHGTVEGNTVLGKNNQVFSYAIVGGKTHDLKFKGGNPGLKIGNNNIFREYCTIHLATDDRENTIIGNNNVFLAYSHVAHDCHIGNHVIMSSLTALAGHVIVGNHVNIGWNAGAHQFCHLGDYCMVGACSKVVQSVFPYMLVDGYPASVRTINKIGLERAGFERADIEDIRQVYKIIYASGLNRSQAMEKLAKEKESSEFAQNILKFAEQNSQRGLM